MLIAVTGGTGYLGSHTVAALLAEGHAVRLLVHPREDVAAALALFGADVDRIETVTGDIRDPKVVSTLLDGCDALLHAAGIVGTDDRREALMWEVNVEATGRILAEATKLGLDPIVHVASYSALFPCPDPVITPDSPTAPGRSAYGRTKSTADRIARALQAAGSPVVITYPASVVGPALGPQAGITADGWAVMLRSGFAPSVRGGMQMVDVRDVAAVHAALMKPGQGPRRYLAGGHLLTFDQIVDLLEEAGGRRIRRIPISPGVFRGIGRTSDLVARLTPLSAGLSYEAAWLLTAATPTDDSRTLADLGVRWRPIRESIFDAMGRALTPVEA
ncbi:NAD-dependent epimerase/dehydratase family protein [Nocardia shimofusensis]|uniref:NAD-dependent epimerase/dehydratase family protein n=1 Tax=Nocardia shimofusensis TaxID=228596 RepID=UPI000831D9DC|nr:NAD-dependent epimerase/dehydratase family protein [Nocardia shimofusensis]